jgi:hypothetical protein
MLRYARELAMGVITETKHAQKAFRWRPLLMQMLPPLLLSHYARFLDETPAR